MDGLREKIQHIKSLSALKLSATFILGGGTETHEDVLTLIANAKELCLDYAHFNPLFVYPGTPLYADIYSDEKAWAGEILNDPLPWGEIIYKSELISCTDLLDLVHYAYREFYRGTPHENEHMVTDRFKLFKEDAHEDL
jgi:radical SAM superfamily enzyme YgiQ (UPF0313 family)